MTRPFGFEGKRRKKHADQGLAELRENVDTLIVIPNQKLLAIAGERTPLLDTFKKADEVLLQACQGIADLINIRGLINLDFADIKTVMANKGMALMGTGRASGENRAVEAATAAISSPLLENVSIDGATGIIINVTGGPDLTMFEVNEASTLITEAAHEDAEIIFGAVIDDTIRDEVRVTVIATGFGREEKTSFADQVSQMHAMSSVETVAPNAPIQQHSMPASWPQPPTIRPIANGLPPIPTPQGFQGPVSQPQPQAQVNPTQVVQQIEMPATHEQSLQKPILPRDILLAKARAFREIQSTGSDKTKRAEPVQLSMPVNPDAQLINNNSSGPDLESARKLAREVGRQFDEKSYDIPAFIRKNQRPQEPQL